MQLEEKHILYPEDLAPLDVCNRIRRVLAAAPANQDVWADPRMDWGNFIQRECWIMGVHPIWPLVSLQRERGLFGKAGAARDFDFAQGVVGQDEAGTLNETWNGLPTQVVMGIRSLAWSCNIGMRGNFGYRAGLWPGWQRWVDGAQNTVQLYNEKHEKTQLYLCQNRAQFGQLKFTPHLDVLDVNGGIYQGRIAPFFG